jgi:delta 1-pyrroline-5-carboxylate dehydrogenase
VAGLGQIRDYDNEPRGAVWWPAVTRTAKELTVPYRSVNPATGEVLKTFTEHTDQEVMAALATADKAFVAWAARPIDERAKIIAARLSFFWNRRANWQGLLR